MREEIQKQQTQVRTIQTKQREKEKRVKEKHEQLIEIQERQRKMQEVIRMKKLEERKEIDNQVDQGLLLVGSPDIKKNRIDIAHGDTTVRHELSEFQNQLGGGGTSARGGSILRSF